MTTSDTPSSTISSISLQAPCFRNCNSCRVLFRMRFPSLKLWFLNLPSIQYTLFVLFQFIGILFQIICFHDNAQATLSFGVENEALEQVEKDLLAVVEACAEVGHLCFYWALMFLLGKRSCHITKTPGGFEI